MPQQFIQNPLNQFEPERLPVGWPWRMFTVSLIILFASVLTYFGLVFGYEPFLNSKIQAADSELTGLSKVITKEDRDQLAQFYSQLVNLKNLLDNHIISSKLFPLLEKITNQKVYYRNANFNVTEGKLELEAVAQSFNVLSEQLESFNLAEEIERYIVNQAQLSEGTVSFKATLKVKSNFLK
ncbi:MAG: hypothetical protein Q7S73_00945 [bacterium]|nr:hypothetical protein [bacterium]